MHTRKEFLAPNRLELGDLVRRKPASKAEVRVGVVVATVVRGRREVSSAMRDFATSGLDPAARRRAVLTGGGLTSRSRSGSNSGRIVKKLRVGL
ncbi:hypothetical protein OROGR_006256 [Orobanche gracilis]